ncbi:MAG: HAMP domain-containing histidine kinase, partial [Duodenibacillus sp.]|nr:HAMP domain-containing histidine kinase [Duodenibacillus sp.]
FVIVGDKSGGREACGRSTGLYPAEVFSVQPHADPALVKAVNVALLTMPRQGRRWEWMPANDFTSISRFMERLQIGPYAWRREWSPEALFRRFRLEILLLAGLALAALFHICRVNMLVRLRTSELVDTIRENRELAEKERRTQQYLGLLERNNAVSQLSNLFAHEMKQPITNIMNYASGLEMLARQQGGQDERSMKVLGIIRDQARRMADIVERVRAYARHQPVEKRDCDLAQVIRAAWDNAALADKSPVALKLAAEPGLAVRGDPVALELLFLNLIRNARRALAGTDGPEVAIRARAAEGAAVVTVADNGPGVSDAVFASLGKAGAVASPGGLGMGLAIAAGIAENHHGHLEFSRPAAGGLQVTVRLALGAKEKDDE